MPQSHCLIEKLMDTISCEGIGSLRKPRFFAHIAPSPISIFFVLVNDSLVDLHISYLISYHTLCRSMDSMYHTPYSPVGSGEVR